MMGEQPAHAGDETPAIVRDAMRVQLLDELAEKSAQRRRAAKMRRTVFAGVVLGVIGAIILHWA
jgi:hypothetical protein